MFSRKRGNPSADATGHTRGVKSGNSKGNYDSQSGHLPDGRRTAEASTGVNPKAREPIDPRMPNLQPG